ncbi:MAG TPA: VOC family protein [Nocardioidaceae bacterium]|nr:VOC family protein [Nocardioidaceae bacterium]
MSRMIFVNLPVKDLAKSVEFFTGLGFEFNAQFTDENATCMVVNEQACVMLLVEPFFSSFTTKDIVDTVTHTETMIALSAESREEVDQLVDRAVAGGGRTTGHTEDHGYMYGRSFEDVDGHIWEVVWMDPSTIE